MIGVQAQKDVTSTYLTNPSFETGDMTGWTTLNQGSAVDPTTLSDCGAREVTSYPLTNSDGDYIMNYYGWSWSWNASENGIRQTIHDLPAGNYRVEAVLGGWEDWEMHLIANGESQTQTMTADDTGVLFSVDITLASSGDLNITAKTTHTGHNAWEACFIKADKFKLYRMADDVTITNPGFDTCTPESSDVAAKTIKNYSANGWTNFATGDFTTVAVTAYGGGKKVGNSTTPATKKDGTGSGNTLGIIAGWGDEVKIQSGDITLSAPGVYTFTVDHYLSPGDNNNCNASSSRSGFVTESTSYLVSSTTFATSTWTTETVTFILTESTTGKIQVGLKGTNSKGSGANAVFYDDVKLTYSPFADDSDYAILNAAISAVEGKALGFDAGEYAPYNHAEVLEALAEAKDINPKGNNSQALVWNLINTLNGATWTANAEEVNAFYGGDFTQYETIGGEDMPYGWNLYNGATNHSRIMGGTEGSSNTGLAATTSGKALLLKFNATYGESEGYTMPLKGGKLYKITFKHGRWAEANPRKTNVIMTDPNGTSITLAPGFQAKNNDCQSNVGNWEEFTGYFVATIDGNYKFNFEKELRSGQNTQMQIAIGDIELKSSTDALEFVDGSAVPTYAPGTYPSVKITRTLTAGNWATAVYPFAVSGVDNIAVLDSYSGETGEISFATAAASTANEPFLMRSTAGTEEISLSNVAVAATVAEPEVTKSVASLKGVYASGIVPESDEDNVRYVVSSNQLYKVDGEVSIKPFRAYFELTGANQLARPTLRFDDVTAINAIEAEETEAGALKDGKYIIDNKVVIVKNGVKYGANGQKLN